MTRGVRRLVAVVAIVATATVGLTACDDRSSRDCRPQAAAAAAAMSPRIVPAPIVVRPPVIRPPAPRPAPPKVYTPPKPVQPQNPAKPAQPQAPVVPGTSTPGLPWYWWVPFIGSQSGRGC